MGIYVKGYRQRAAKIIAVVAIVAASLLLCYGLFQGKLNKVCGQLNSYQSADYSIIYILNYCAGVDNECNYPDSDIQFYTGADRKQRLTVSSIMVEEGVSYNLKYLDPLTFLKPGEAYISQTVAEDYCLDVGDSIFTEYPYSHELILTKVVGISQTEFDFGNPSIDNNIGMVFLGVNDEYINTTRSKAILFADHPATNELSAFPQIISKVINKSENNDTVIFQAIPVLVFATFFSLTAVALAEMAFFSKSRKPLYRCYLKGMRRYNMAIIPLVERMAFYFFPCVIVQCIISARMPDSSITRAFRIIPIFICSAYCIIMFTVDLHRFRRKGI